MPITSTGFHGKRKSCWYAGGYASKGSLVYERQRHSSETTGTTHVPTHSHGSKSPLNIQRTMQLTTMPAA